MSSDIAQDTGIHYNGRGEQNRTRDGCYDAFVYRERDGRMVPTRPPDLLAIPIVFLKKSSEEPG